MESLITSESSEVGMGEEAASLSFSRDFQDNSSRASLTSSESNTSLMPTLSQELSSLLFQLDYEKALRIREENQLYLLIEAVTEAEIELELLGRSHKSLRSVISNIIKKTCNSASASSKSSYSHALTKMILTIYSNQMKTIEINNNSRSSPSSSSILKSNYGDEETLDSDLNDDRHSIRSSLEHLDLEDDYVSDDAERCLSALAHELNEDEMYEEEEREGEDSPYATTPSRPLSAPSGLEIVFEEEDEIETYSPKEHAPKTFQQFQEPGIEEEDLNEIHVREVVESLLFQVEEDEKTCQIQVWDPFESDFLMAMKREQDENGQFTSEGAVEGILIELVTDAQSSMLDTPSSIRSASIDSAIGSSTSGDATQVQVLTEETSSNCSFMSGSNPKQAETVINNSNAPSNEHQSDLILLSQRVDELNEAFKLQSRELSAAIDKVSQLEDKLTRNGRRNSEHHILADEISAWKDLVEQQKAVLEKITLELDSTRHELKEQNFLIEQLMAEKETSPQEMLTVESIVSKREKKWTNITVASTDTQVACNEQEITRHPYQGPEVEEEDGNSMEKEMKDEKEADYRMSDQELEEGEEKNDRDIVCDEQINDCPDEEEDEEHQVSLKQMDLLSFSYLNSPSRKKIESSRRIHFLDKSEPTSPSDDQEPSSLHFNHHLSENDILSVSDDGYSNVERVLNSRSSLEHPCPESAFPARSRHISTPFPPLNVYSPSTVTEDALPVGYEPPSSSRDQIAYSTITSISDGSVDDCRFDDDSMAKVIQHNVDGHKMPKDGQATSRHEYCTHPQVYGSSNTYSDSYKKYSNRNELKMKRVEIIFVPKSETKNKRFQKSNPNMDPNNEGKNGTFLPFLVLDEKRRKMHPLPPFIPY